MTYAYIVAGAIVGAPLRYFIGARMQEWAGLGFPWGTLLVNVIGCLLIGLVLGLADERGMSREARLLLVTGFLGSYTTFSAFGFETFQLLRDGDTGKAIAYVLASNLLGLAAVWAGWAGTTRTALA